MPIDETNAYLKQHPDCIMGTYYNMHTKGALCYIKLRPDSTYLHVCKYQNTYYVDSGKWTYDYDDGQEDVNFPKYLAMSELEGFAKEKNNPRLQSGFVLLDCASLITSFQNNERTLNFYKDTTIRR